MNIEVRCPRCGNWILVAFKKLEWIRCPTCHKGVHIRYVTRRLKK